MKKHRTNYGSIKHQRQNHLKIFSGEVFAHIPKEKRRIKRNQKERKGIFVGYSEETKGYHICFGGREISLSRDVIFSVIKPINSYRSKCYK